jgi:conjugal transfer ATP-binding protein TraC
MSGLRRATAAAWHTDAEPFPDYLPYVACVEDAVLLSDRFGQAPSIGRMWELEPVCLEGAAEERWDSVATAIDGLLLRLPEDSACQFFLIGDPHIDPELTAFQAQGQVNGLVRAACEERVQLYHASVHTPLFEHKGVPFRCRRVRAYCTVRLWPTPPRRHGRPLFARPAVEAWLEHACTEIAAVEDVLQEGVHLAGIGLRRLDASAVKALLWRFVNPGEALPPSPYRDGWLLREQLLAHHPHVDGHGIAFGAQHVTILSAAEPPFETRPGLFVRELDFGGAHAALLDLFPELCLVYNVHILNQQQAYARVKRHKSMAWLNRLDPLQGLSIETQVVAEDLEKVMAEVFGRGQRVLSVGVHAVLAGHAEELAVTTNRVIAAVGHLGFRLAPEETIGASLFVHCLPLGFDPASDSMLCRTHRYVSSNVADLLPMYGYFRGVGTRRYLFLWLNRHGEPVSFDPFDAAPAPHGLVAGYTGVGKTVFIMDMIVQGLRLGAHIFVLDKGDSYHRLCQLVGGRRYVFDPDHPPCTNPFAGPLSPERLAALWQLVVEMMQGRTERDVLGREEEGMIERAISDTYRRLGHEEVTLSDVAASLQAQGTYGARLAFRLEPFLRTGRYGRFLDGPNTLRLDTPLTVFELGQLNRDPELQKVMVMVLVNMITQVVAHERERVKLLFVDEAWSLLTSANAARFLGEAARTYRKYGTALISITQQPRDFLETAGGRAVRDNAPIRFLLPQPPDVAQEVAHELGLSAEKTALFTSLESVPGKFAEALLETPTGSGVIRIVLPPSLYWITTSTERERRYLEELSRRLGSLEAAIAHAAATYPHGLVGLASEFGSENGAHDRNADGATPQVQQAPTTQTAGA